MRKNIGAILAQSLAHSAVWYVTCDLALPYVLTGNLSSCAQEIARNFAIFPGNTPRKMHDLLVEGNDFSAVLNRFARANHVVWRANVPICQNFNSILQRRGSRESVVRVIPRPIKH